MAFLGLLVGRGVCGFIAAIELAEDGDTHGRVVIRITYVANCPGLHLDEYLGLSNWTTARSRCVAGEMLHR